MYEIHLASEAGREQVRQDLLVVAMEEQPAAIEPLRPVRPAHAFVDDARGRFRREPLDQLRRERPDLPQRTLADP